MSSRLTRVGDFRQAMTTAASPTIAVASCVSAISIEPSRISTRSTAASITRRLSDANAMAGDGADAIRADARVSADRDAVETHLVVADPGASATAESDDALASVEKSR